MTLRRWHRVFPKAVSRYPRKDKIQGVKVKRWWFFLDFAYYLLKESRDSDIIHLHGPFVPYPQVLLYLKVSINAFNLLKTIKRLLKKPTVVTMHGLHQRYNQEMLFVDKMALDTADIVIAVDSEIYRDLSSLGKENVLLVPNGVQIESPSNVKQETSESTLNEHLNIICPRRLDPKNGIEYAILALKEILNDCKRSIEMTITGPCYKNEYERKIRKQVEELGLSKQVHICDGFKHSELIKLMQASSVALFPSLWEATSIAVLECLSLGIPVVAFKTGGLKDLVIHGFNGFLVPQKDYKSMAKHLKTLLNSTELRKTISKNAVSSVEIFSLDKMCERVMKAYSAAFKMYCQNGVNDTKRRFK